MICIHHQHKVPNLVCKAQRHSCRVDTLKYLLGIVIWVQADINTCELLDPIVDLGHCHAGRLLLPDQITEQLIVMPDSARLINFIHFPVHEEEKLVVIALYRLQLQLAGNIDRISVERVAVDEDALNSIPLAVCFSHVHQRLQKQINCRHPLLAINYDIVIDVIFEPHKGVYHRTTEVFLTSMGGNNDVLEQLHTLILGPLVVSLIDRNSVLTLILLYKIVHDPARIYPHVRFLSLGLSHPAPS